MNKNLSSLLKKRATLEAKIAAAEASEKRKIEICLLPEFQKILAVPDEILRSEFLQISQKHGCNNSAS
jgi:hypothetical protein